MLRPDASGNAHVCIVGGGLSGVALAWQLLHRLRTPAHIVLINKAAQLGHGLAYGTSSPHHLLNVPVGRMGVDPQNELGFLHYIQRQSLPFGASDFVPRSVYGAYLNQTLADARVEALAHGVTLQVLQANAIDLQPQATGGYIVQLQDGASVPANQVVLALGNFAAALPLQQPGLDWRAPGLYQSAWDLTALAPAAIDAPALLLGSGLTAFDALLQLRHYGHRGVVTMLSRRGLLAQAHRRQERQPPQDIVPVNVLEGICTARAMLRDVRHRIRQAQQVGHDWRDVIGGLRESTPRLWQQLPPAERARFVRHLAPYWDTHRHRAAVSTAQVIQKELAAGSLVLMAGRLRALKSTGDQWQATIALRGNGKLQTLAAGVVVNCTGPSSNVRNSSDHLITSLLQQGRLLPDPLGLGLQVDAHYRLRNAQGQGQPALHYLGPLLKAEFWEATAVPELRKHASRLAEILVAHNCNHNAQG